MNHLETQLQYPFGDALPALGNAMAIHADVKWVRMGLPYVLDHINLWLLRDEINGVVGWSVVDCCIDHSEARAQWESIFTHALEGLPILRVIVTHMHPDHIGLAHWLCQRWNAPLWMSASDYYLARLASLGRDAAGIHKLVHFFAMHGLNDPQTQEKLQQRSEYFPTLVPAMPPYFVRLIDGKTLSIGAHTWRCISGHGHSPEHIALYCEAQNLLIGGDMMLPRISTNVSVYEDEPEANAVTDFLHSIDKFQSLPSHCLVLPSHGKPFIGLATRIAQLHSHHQDRLADVMAVCSQKPCSAADVMPILFKRPMDFHQTTFALGEAVAHLNALWLEGKLQREKDAAGVYRFFASTMDR